MQDIPSTDYIASKRETVIAALARAGLPDAAVEALVQVAPQTRRRAVFKLAKTPDGFQIGFHAARSHDIVDMRECLVLTPVLFDLAQALRARLSPVLHDGEKAELHVTQTETGFDCVLRWSRNRTPELVAALAQAIKGLSIARLILNNDLLLESTAPTVSFDGITVRPPPQAFLQPTLDGEAALRSRVVAHLGKAKTVADLFSGCGTFSLPLARKARVHAVEQDAAMLAALAAAAKTASGLKPVTTEARDLFKRPLTLLELNAYDGVVLDPPRAGAEAQARVLAASKVSRIAYVSCDAATFARDARLLVQGGYRMAPVTPVDQFLWSSHIELVGGFFRGRA